MPQQYTLEEFGKRIKAKYPQYAGLSDSDIANKVLAKYPQYKAAIKASAPAPTSPAPTGVIRPLTERERFTMTYPVGVKGEGIGENLHNVAQNAGVGIFEFFDALAHPVKTAENLAASVTPQPVLEWGKTHGKEGALRQKLARGETLTKEEQQYLDRAEELENTPNPIATVYGGVSTRPGEFIPNLLGQAIAGYGFGEAVKPVTEAVVPATRALRETSRGLGEKVVQTATGTGPKATAELVKKVQAGNEAADAYSSLRARIETAQENALKIGNQKYAAVNPALNPLEADPEFMQGALADATESLKGSKGEPTLLKDIEVKLRRGDPFTYEDLQGDYSRLGKELSKGTLPGDEFHAYDKLHEAIGEEMQRIADSKGMGEQLTDARAYWRRMKQTFGKPLTETDAATSALRSTSPDLAEQSTIANRVRLLGSFDAEIPREFARLERAQEAAKGAPKPVPGETGKIGTEEIREAKAQAVQKTADFLRRRALTFGTFLVGYRALGSLSRAMIGDVSALAGLPPDVAEGIGLMGGMHGMANLLENPRVLRLLTEPTARDVAQIPPELRGELKPVVQAAQRQGIKVDPRLAAAVGVTLAGVRTQQQTRSLKELREEAAQRAPAAAQ